MSLATLRPHAARLLGLGLAVASLYGMQRSGERFYAGFRIPQGFGMTHLLPEELAFTGLFVVFGCAAMLGGALALEGLPMVGALGRRLRDLPTTVASLAAAAGLALGSAAIAALVLAHTVVTDDEHVYRFIAQTLRTGHVTAPSPGTDLDFFREQFVVLTETVRFGKYPLGHPALLAVGQALGLENWVVPLLTAALAFPVVWLGRRLFDGPTANVALLLLLTSPQVLTTGATFLSQPASTLCLLLALACLVEGGTEGRPGWTALAGVGLACGVLVRPLPGVLFVVAAVGWLLWTRRSSAGRGFVPAAALVAPVALAGAALLLVNRVQTGGFLVSGYQAFHVPQAAGPLVTVGMGGGFAELAMSVASSLIRLDVWLLGWPLSLAPLLFARAVPRVALLWGMVGMAFAYRLITPKAGVGVTGPQYMMEVVPVLCLLAAHGLVRLARHPSVGRWVLPAAAMGLVVNVSLFLPYKLADLQRCRLGQRLLPQMLARQAPGPKVVFHRGIVPYATGLSWAYGPPCNPPDLRADVLYMRYDAALPARNLEFWKRRYPERSAWVFTFADNEPRLLRLEDVVRGAP